MISRRAPVLLLAAGLLACGCGGSGPVDGAVCSGTGVCGSGYCVVGRCRPADVLPSPIDARRVLLAPEDIAVLTSRGGDGETLPDSVALGQAAAGDLVLLLRFAATWRDDADVASAFLVLDPVEGAPPAAGTMTLEVARILDPWRSDAATWGRQPRLSIPEVAAVVRRRPAATLRVDVTRLVRDWAKRRRDDHGIAVLAPGSDPVGATYSLGAAFGEGPRLEVYVR